MPPKIVSSTRSAKRRSSWRESPGPPRQTWYCSVSLRSNRRLALGARGVSRRSCRRRGCSRRRRTPARRPASTSCVVVDRAGGGDHDVLRRVARRRGSGDLGRRRVGDHRRAADDRAAERVLAEHGLAEHVEHLLLRIVLVHRDLLEDHRALGVDVVERRAEHHVGHHVERLGEVLVDHAGVDRGRLLAGAGVELGAHRVEDLVDLERLVLRGALEQQVLEQVREPGLLLALGARAGADPEPERHGSDGGHRLRHDPDARFERRQPVFLVH